MIKHGQETMGDAGGDDPQPSPKPVVQRQDKALETGTNGGKIVMPSLNPAGLTTFRSMTNISGLGLSPSMRQPRTQGQGADIRQWSSAAL